MLLIIDSINRISNNEMIVHFKGINSFHSKVFVLQASTFI